MQNCFEAQLALPVPFDPAPYQAEISPAPYHIDPNCEFVKWLHSLGLEILKTGAEQFYIPPGGSIPIHIDGKNFDNKVKLNFQHNGKGSKMRWYQLTQSNTVLNQKIGDFGAFSMIQPDQVTQVWQAEIGFPSLVNAGILHNVTNQSEPRWVISVPLWDTELGQNLQWHRAQDKFHPWLVGNHA
jgi:hypothetical protein